MTGVVVVLAVLTILVLLGLAFLIVPGVLQSRRELRRGAERALVVQAANQRLRAVSQEAIGSMLSSLDQRFDGRGR